jgi:hypothetical protein
MAPRIACSRIQKQKQPPRWCWPARRFFQLAHHVGDGRLLLADGNVDTLNAGIFLVDDRVDRHRGLTGLTVTDDQLTLATADGIMESTAL